jgi:hypothetical protein
MATGFNEYAKGNNGKEYYNNQKYAGATEEEKERRCD